MKPVQETELLDRARDGDEAAFSELVRPHRAAMLGIGYRMLGSYSDAEDLVQDALVRAWRAIDAFERRSSFRTWLFRITTNACLDRARQRARTLPQRVYPPGVADAAAEHDWLEPIPDRVLAGAERGPDARYELSESIQLAFMVALQQLPPRQRAVLILRDVLGLSADEVASLLDMTSHAVHSLLARSRRALKGTRPPGDRSVAPRDDEERELLSRYLEAWQRSDVDALVALLREDAVYAMPPMALWLQGRAAIASLLHRLHADGEMAATPIALSGGPGLAGYTRPRGDAGPFRAAALVQIRIADGAIAEVQSFLRPDLFARFGLPPQV